MAYKQTRRSISLSGELYQALAEQARSQNLPISTVVEKAMREHLGLAPRRLDARVAAPTKKSRAKKTASPQVEVADPVAAAVEAPPKSRFITNTLKLTRPPRHPPERFGLPKPEKEPPAPRMPDAKSIFTF